MPDYPNTHMKRPAVDTNAKQRLEVLEEKKRIEAQASLARLDLLPPANLRPVSRHIPERERETTEQRYKRLTGRELADDRDGTLEQQIKDRTLAYIALLFIEAIVVLFIMSFLTVNAVITWPVAVVLFLPGLILLDMIKYYGFKLVGKIYASIQAKAVQDILTEQNIDPNTKGNLTLHEE